MTKRHKITKKTNINVNLGDKKSQTGELNNQIQKRCSIFCVFVNFSNAHVCFVFSFINFLQVIGLYINLRVYFLFSG